MKTRFILSIAALALAAAAPLARAQSFDLLTTISTPQIKLGPLTIMSDGTQGVPLTGIIDGDMQAGIVAIRTGTGTGLYQHGLIKAMDFSANSSSPLFFGTYVGFVDPDVTAFFLRGAGGDFFRVKAGGSVFFPALTDRAGVTVVDAANHHLRDANGAICVNFAAAPVALIGGASVTGGVLTGGTISATRITVSGSSAFSGFVQVSSSMTVTGNLATTSGTLVGFRVPAAQVVPLTSATLPTTGTVGQMIFVTGSNAAYVRGTASGTAGWLRITP
jgi:hypothetical protein